MKKRLFVSGIILAIVLSIVLAPTVALAGEEDVPREFIRQQNVEFTL
ncbi:hypothetical protein PRVXH_000668 [Proteinivorax hydrogeniformans]|uniref:Uncharacterized protein n=1 Tax=Proteinivorax hydrogeniformans TaxID=1826727 RepID=A0AAU8HVD3_9FIRM